MAKISITAPSRAEEGDKVNASVKVTSTLDWHASYRGDIEVVPDFRPGYVIDEIDQIILAGDSVTRKVSFTMPDCNVTVFIWLERWSKDHWVYDSSGSKVVSLEVPVPVPITGELISAYAWWEGKDGWNEILETNTWPLKTAIITTWKVKNTGDESAVFKTRLLGVESAEAWLTPGATFSFEQPAISLGPGTHHFTLQIMADDEVVTEYPFQVITEEIPVEPFDPWSYDFNGNGVIEISELVAAANDYYAGIITKEQLDQVTALWEAAPPTTFHLSILVPSWAAGGYIDPGSGDYPAYSTVTLTAHPHSGYQFTGWGGDASGTSPTYNLYMDSDKYVEAYFEKVPVPEFAGTISKKELEYDETRENIPVY